MTTLWVAAVTAFITARIMRGAGWWLRHHGSVHVHIRLRRRRADVNTCEPMPPRRVPVGPRLRLHGQRITDPLDRSPEQQRIDHDALAARGVLPGLYRGGDNAAPVCPSCGTLLPYLREIPR